MRSIAGMQADRAELPGHAAVRKVRSAPAAQPPGGAVRARGDPAQRLRPRRPGRRRGVRAHGVGPICLVVPIAPPRRHSRGAHHLRCALPSWPSKQGSPPRRTYLRHPTIDFIGSVQKVLRERPQLTNIKRQEALRHISSFRCRYRARALKLKHISV